MGFGIALSGGGTRGAAHVGVLCALEEEGLRPTSVAGTSAGSIVAGLYALGMSGQEMKDRIYELARQGTKLIDPDYTPSSAVFWSSSGKKHQAAGVFEGRQAGRLFEQADKGQKDRRTDHENDHYRRRPPQQEDDRLHQFRPRRPSG